MTSNHPPSQSQSRERRPSVGVPIAELTGPVGPGFSRPKHKRTNTGFGPTEIKKVEASIPEPQREAYVYPTWGVVAVFKERSA